MSNLLIVYYSWSNGNTKGIAEQLRQIAGGDIVRIETAVPYQGGYDAVVAQGQKEVNQGYMPQIKHIDADWAAYDYIAVGTPTWWYTMAPAVRTFFASYDFSGKTVIPFATHGGWPGHVLADMQTACAGADVACSMDIRFDSAGGNTMKTSPAAVRQWAEQVAALAGKER